MSKIIGTNGKSFAENNYSYEYLGPKIKKFIDNIFFKKKSLYYII